MGAVHVRGGQGVVARALVARLGASTTEEAEAEVVVDLSAPGVSRRDGWVRDVEAGRHVLATSLDPADVAWARDRFGATARSARLVVVPNAGMAAVFGDLLGALAAGAVTTPREVHTAHLVAERGGLLGVAGAGLRAELAALVGVPAVAWERGAPVEEPIGERRRLAWFARPVGPHHAASVPAPEVVTIPSHVGTATTVTGHLAMKTWQAEVLQGLGNLSRLPRVAAAVRRRVADPRPARPQARWAVVAEAEGGEGVARAWANGRDLAETNAGVLAALVRALDDAPVRGVVAPAQLVDPATFLDEVAADVDLRWSLIRPEVEEDGGTGRASAGA